MTARRTERVGDLIRAELSDLLRRAVHDPGMGFVTITQVTMSADLRTARVYFSCLGGSEQFAQTLAAFDRAAGFLRREVGQRCRLRYAPELHFFADRSAETGARIEEILRKNLPPESDGEDPGT